MDIDLIIFIVFVIANSIVAVLSNLPLYKHNKYQKEVLKLQKQMASEGGFKHMINRMSEEINKKSP